MESPVLLAMILWLPCISGQININCTEDVCTTKECISVANDMIETLDESMDPCQDFYQYACGGWMQNQFLRPEEYTRTLYHSKLPFLSVKKLLAKAPRRTDHGAVKKAKNMYTSCVRYAKVSTNYKEIARVVNATFGRWPLTCDNCPMDGFNLEQFLLEAIHLGVHPLFTLKQPDARLPAHIRQSRLSLVYPELGFPSHEYLKLSKKHIFRRTYADTIYSVAKHFGAENYGRAGKESKEIVQVEIALAMMQFVLKPRRDNIFNLTTLDQNYGKLLNWTSFLTRLELIQNMNSSLTVEVMPTNYLQTMTDYFSQLPARTQANYIIWRVIDTLQSVLLDERKKLNTIVLQIVNGDTRVPLPEEACAIYVSKVFQLVVHRLLYDAHLPGNKLDTLYLMIGSIQREFDALLDEHVLVNQTDLHIMREKLNLMMQSLHRESNALLDEHVLVNQTDLQIMRDKLNLLQSLHRGLIALLDEPVFLNLTDLQIMRDKNNAMNTVLEFHLHAMNDSFLETYYSNVTIDRRHFITNVVESRKDTFAKQFRLSLDYHIFEKADPPYQIQARYVYRLNRIEINSVLAQHPNWIDNVPASINFARYGAIIGHELMHGAISGHTFDKNGIRGAWWNNETVVYFEDRYRCLVAQYSAFFYAPAGIFLRGKHTLNENIADNAGLKLAYRAYINYTKSGNAKEQQFPGLNFSNKQIFFLAYAQKYCTVGNNNWFTRLMTYHETHSPHEFRVIGPLQNSQEFANAFNCSVGSRMNPATKCQPW